MAWEKCKKPKLRGGLGVLDLEKFSRALRLRWLWYSWVDPDRPWVSSAVPCSEIDKQLFRCCTRVTVGDGRTALFWDSSWVNGHAPRDIAPHLYKLAWRKGCSRGRRCSSGWTRTCACPRLTLSACSPPCTRRSQGRRGRLDIALSGEARAGGGEGIQAGGPTDACPDQSMGGLSAKEAAMAFPAASADEPAKCSTRSRDSTGLGLRPSPPPWRWRGIQLPPGRACMTRTKTTDD